MSYRAAQPSFSGGEVGKQIAARYDTAKYPTALERARNVLLLVGGGFYNRPGLEFCGQHIDYTKKARIIPFVFAVDESYALEFSHLTMRVLTGGQYITRPRLTITAITQANPAVVTVPDNDYVIGWKLDFRDVLGMTEINGLNAIVTNVTGDDVEIDLDTSGFSPFTGDAGGIAGNANGGVGGYPGTLPDAPGLPDDTDLPPVFEFKGID